jgi:hypothetical protein
MNTNKPNQTKPNQYRIGGRCPKMVWSVVKLMYYVRMADNCGGMLKD